MRNRARRRSLIALTSFAYYRRPGRREDPNGDTGNANAGGGGSGGTGSGQGGSAGGDGQQGGQSGGQGAGNGGGQNEPQTVDQLPGWTQRLIAELRRENAAKRTATGGANDNNGEGQPQAGGQSGGQQASPPNGNATTNDDAETRAQAAEIKSAVVLAAVKAGANPIALTDSISFLHSVKGLDPNDEKAFTEAIKKAMEKNPALKAVQAAGRSGGEFTGGPGGSAEKEPSTPGERLRRGYAKPTT